MIESNNELAEHLEKERDVYARALEMYRIGQIRFVANNIDLSTFQMTDLQGIVSNIDQLLERMRDSENRIRAEIDQATAETANAKSSLFDRQAAK